MPFSLYLSDDVFVVKCILEERRATICEWNEKQVVLLYNTMEMWLRRVFKEEDERKELFLLW